MPRQARLDAPGTLHHVIVRGIEKRPAQRGIDDRTDRDNFVSRLGQIASETETVIYAWALMTNHAHIFLRSGPYGLSKCMQRFLIGYAVTYNRRHHRYGHLFQNRYKSIVCDEDSYFRELVRYIHLNPLRAKRRDKERVLTDERILGSGDFVERIPREADETLKYQFRGDKSRQKVVEFVEQVYKKENINSRELRMGSRRGRISQVRSQIAYQLVEDYGLPCGFPLRRKYPSSPL